MSSSPFRNGQDIALGIMCKAPIEGTCKTRLCPPLTPKEAAALSRSFIADVAALVADVARSAACGLAIHAPTADGLEDLQDVLPDGLPLLVQRGADLGERLLHATQDLLAVGFAGVCFIGADSPTLPAALLEQAVGELRRPGDRIVLGPAIDGGYYLLGLKRAHAELFRGVSWSSNLVLAQTLCRIAGSRLPVTLLPLWYDVDDLASLQLLMHELFGADVPLSANGLVGSSAGQTSAHLRGLLLGEKGDRFGFPTRLVADRL
ncbi:MAG: TIGR04282 family arsenosugar biosynthesis glycosyltransferase [Rhodospirillales bacterium]